MVKCVLRRYNEDGVKVDMTCEYVRQYIEEIKKSFREKHGTDLIISSGRNDRLYDELCMTLERFLKHCKCKPLEG